MKTALVGIVTALAVILLGMRSLHQAGGAAWLPIIVIAIGAFALGTAVSLAAVRLAAGWGLTDDR